MEFQKRSSFKSIEFGLTPDSVKILHEKGHKVIIETNGGFEAGFSDQDYQKAGGLIYNDAKDIFKDAEIIVKVKEPQLEEVKMIREDQIIYTYLHLLLQKNLLKV